MTKKWRFFWWIIFGRYPIFERHFLWFASVPKKTYKFSVIECLINEASS